MVWATGYGLDFSWVDLPIADESGMPIHQRGITEVEGLYVLGLPWLHTWGSGRFCGVAADADHLAAQILEKIGRLDQSPVHQSDESLQGR